MYQRFRNWSDAGTFDRMVQQVPEFSPHRAPLHCRVHRKSLEVVAHPS
nr:hypothetical protein [Pseudomonas congelans]